MAQLNDLHEHLILLSIQNDFIVLAAIEFINLEEQIVLNQRRDRCPHLELNILVRSNIDQISIFKYFFRNLIVFAIRDLIIRFDLRGTRVLCLIHVDLSYRGFKFLWVYQVRADAH